MRATRRCQPGAGTRLQRAVACDQRFALDAAVLSLAIALCRSLDGNALAIELAAARAPQLGVAALQQRLGERLRVLHSPGAARPARQQSLRATLDWSTALLGDAERAMLRRLGVFQGSFSLHSAQTLCTDASFDDWAALDALGVLVDRSLVQVDAASPPRYRLLETTRLYAQDLRAAAGDAAATVLRHGQVMAALSRRLHADFHTLGYRQLRERHGADYVDLDAAFESACSRGDAGVGAMTAQALLDLDRAGQVTASTRRRMVAAHALLATADDDLLQAWLCNGASPVASVAIPGVPRLALAEQRVAAWRAVGNPQELYQALAALAAGRARAGDEAAADAAAAEALTIEDCRWPPALRMVGARIDANVAICSRRNGPGRMTVAFRAMLALAQQSGDEERVAVARDCLADATTASADLPEAIALCHLALADELRQFGAERGHTLMNLCAATLLSGDEATAPARALAARALPLLRLNLYAGVLFNHLSLLAARTGDARLAAPTRACRPLVRRQPEPAPAGHRGAAAGPGRAGDRRGAGPGRTRTAAPGGCGAHRRRGRRAGPAAAGPAVGPAAGGPRDATGLTG